MPRFILPFVDQALKPSFLYYETYGEAFSLALVAGLPVIFTGPGGYGKSEMSRAVMSAIDAPLFIKSFGTGTQEADLFGGMVAVTTVTPDKETTTATYNVERSFLNYPLVLFEEMLDMPARCLCELKDTLTSGEYHQGADSTQLLTKMLVACTNADIDELLREGDKSIDALLQRFMIVPIQWQNHGSRHYQALYKKVSSAVSVPQTATVSLEQIEAWQKQVNSVVIPDKVLSTLATLAERAANVTGEIITPRTFVRMTRLVQAAAVISGETVAQFQHINAVRYIQGMAPLLKDLEEEIRQADLNAKCEGIVNNYRDQLSKLSSKVDSATLTNIAIFTVELRRLSTDLSQLTVTDDYVEIKKTLLNAVDEQLRKVDERMQSLVPS